MARSEKAAAAIATMFARNPGATLQVFLEAAAKADPTVAGMPKRSFNATYLLPLKRAAAPKKARTTRKKPGPKPGTKRGPKPGTKRGPKRGPKVAPSGAVGAGGTRKPVRMRSTGSDGASAARQLVLQRDQQLLTALRSGGDPIAAYELAASVDDFVGALVAALRG